MYYLHPTELVSICLNSTIKKCSVYKQSNRKNWNQVYYLYELELVSMLVIYLLQTVLGRAFESHIDAPFVREVYEILITDAFKFSNIQEACSISTY
jgi:hypothetical protein